MGLPQPHVWVSLAHVWKDQFLLHASLSNQDGSSDADVAHLRSHRDTSGRQRRGRHCLLRTVWIKSQRHVDPFEAASLRRFLY